MKKLLYGSKFRRVLMRAIEVFLVGGISALFLTPETVNFLPPVVATAIGAALLKFLRELK